MRSRFIAWTIGLVVLGGAFVLVGRARAPVAQPAARAASGLAGIIELIPGDALAAAAIDVDRFAALFPLLPAELLTGPESPIMAAVDEVFESRVGFRPSGARTLAGFVAFDESWGVIGLGPIAASLRDAAWRTYRGQAIHQIETGGRRGEDLYAVVSADRFIVGSLAAVTGVLDVLHGGTQSFASRPAVSRVVTGLDPDTGFFALVAGDTVGVFLDRVDIEVGGPARTLSATVSPTRTRWVIGFDSPVEAAAADALITGWLLGAGTALEELEAAAEAAEEFGEELGLRLLHVVAADIIEGRMSHSAVGDTVQLEVSGPPALAWIGSFTVPSAMAFQGYRLHSRTSEASMNVRRLYDSSVSYFDADHVAPTGEILPPQFPASAPLTPAAISCGTAREPNLSDWEHPTWEALNFALVDPNYYSYQYDSTGVGPTASFTASAFGDLDCDGLYSTFVRVGTIESTDWGYEIRGGAGLYVMDEAE